MLSKCEIRDLATVQLEVTDWGSAGRSLQIAPHQRESRSTRSADPREDKLLWRLSTGTVAGRARQEFRDDDSRLHAMILETQSPVNPGDSGGPVVNGRVELVGLVAAVKLRERLVSINIDLTEVRSFVGEYFRSVDGTWNEPDAEGLPPWCRFRQSLTT